MIALDIVASNLLSPMLLAFVAGALAVFVGGDLRLPDPIPATLSTYLLFAIGLKGGVALSKASLAEVLLPIATGVTLGAIIPAWCFAACRRLGGLSRADAAAIAAHYGSVSAVTFIAALAYMTRLEVPVEGFMPAVLALMEVPAILIGLLLARDGTGGGESTMEAVHEVFSSRSILLLIAGLAIGWASGPQGYETVTPFFVAPFQGVLTLFLLDMGGVAARRLRELRGVGAFLVAFALLAPLVNGMLGVVAGTLAGLSLGGTTVMAVLAASASYIAAPAAVRIAIPEANPTLYLTPVLGITFPFNLAIGLPLYHEIARHLQGVAS
ncbi:MAG: sodium-dependent bicarbonate transport family permease [Alphaproteobacteria bacterium]